MATTTAWLERYAFKSFVPATNNPSLGWSKYPLEEALTKKHLYTNPASLTSMLVFDIDREHAEDFIVSKMWDTEEIPVPNWITTNLSSTHAHAGYWLRSPVSTSDASSQKARVFLYDTQKKLTQAISGDVLYTHQSTRSPFASGHCARFDREEPYDLGELAETLKHIKIQKTFKLDTGQGRNVELFEYSRRKAYEVKRLMKSYQELHDYVLQFTDETNRRMYSSNPLPYSEIKSITKSIAGWTWRNLTPEKYSAKQTYRINKRWDKVKKGDISGENRLLKLSETRDEILFLKERGCTYEEISKATGLTKNQIKRKLSYARSLSNKE